MKAFVISFSFVIALCAIGVMTAAVTQDQDGLQPGHVYRQAVKSDQSLLNLYPARTEAGRVWYANAEECAAAAAGYVAYDDGNRFGHGPQNSWGGDNTARGGASWIICGREQS